MKRIFFLASLLCFALIVPASSYSQTQECRNIQGTDLFYINGMRTDPVKASIAIQRVRQIFPEYPVYNGYVRTSTSTWDNLVEVINQRRATSNTPSVRDVDDQTYLRAYFKVLSGLNFEEHPQLDQFISDEIEAIRSEYYIELSETFNTNRDMEEILYNMRRSLNNERNIIMLGFSQGSIYANSAYDLLVLENPEWENRIGIFNSGNVTNYIAPDNTTGGHFTYHNDRVVNLVRLLRPNTLAPSFTRQRNLGSNHAFADYYGNTLKPKEYPASEWGTQTHQVSNIQANLDSQICEDIEPTPTPVPTTTPEPAILCDGGLFTGGGTNGFSGTVLVGSEPGTVHGIFDAYTIPDAIDIRTQNGGEIFSSDGRLINGQYLFSYDHTGGDNNTTIDVSVTGNSDPETAWSLNIGCPGSPSSNLYRTIQVTVQNFNRGALSCKHVVTIDGREVINSYNNTSLFYKGVVTEGNHVIERQSSCECSSVGNCATSQGNFLVQGDTLFTSLPNLEQVEFYVGPAATSGFRKMQVLPQEVSEPEVEPSPITWLIPVLHLLL